MQYLHHSAVLAGDDVDFFRVQQSHISIPYYGTYVSTAFMISSAGRFNREVSSKA